MDILTKIEEKFNKNKYLNSISKGFSCILSLTVFGSLFSIITNFPVDSFTNFLSQNGLDTWINLPTLLTIDLISIYVSFTISYSYGKEINKEPLIYGIVGLFSFLMLTPMIKLVTIDNVFVTTLDISRLGAKGLFVAMFAAVFSSLLYEKLTKHGFTLKFSNDIPKNVSESFVSLIPLIIIGCFFLIISYLFSITKFGNIHELIFLLIQKPLSLLSNSIFAVIIFTFFISFLWWFGIHGGAIVNSIMKPIFLPLALENLSNYKNGLELEHIYTHTFNNVYNFGGSGMTISLCILMMFFSKSKKYSTLGKLSLATNIFSINEPIIFSTPIILNPTLFIPFVLSPVISVVLAYYATYLNILPKLIGLQLPWTTPPIISGFLQGGIRVAMFQGFLIFLNILIYLPFFKYMDIKNYAQTNKEIINLNKGAKRFPINT